LTKIPLTCSVSYFNLGGLAALFGELSPPWRRGWFGSKVSSPIATLFLRSLEVTLLGNSTVFQKHAFSVWNICNQHRRNVSSPNRRRRNDIAKTASRKVLDAMVALYAQASKTFIRLPHKRTKNDQRCCSR